MRAFQLSLFLFGALLMPYVGTAQVISRPEPPPAISAAAADWYAAGEPIFHAGHFYFPTGPSIFFDGNVMVRTDIYQGVPLYADRTLEPWSIVYVPIGGNVMRPYERRRDGDLAGTTGSRTPSFPVQGPRDPVTGSTGLVIPELQLSIGTRGTAVPRAAAASPDTAPVSAPAAAPGPTGIETIPPPSKNEGVWINFDGARWFYAGPSVTYQADKFEPIGSYHGFAVYREKAGPDTTVFVSAVQDGGALIPYNRR